MKTKTALILVILSFGTTVFAQKKLESTIGFAKFGCSISNTLNNNAIQLSGYDFSIFSMVYKKNNIKHAFNLLRIGTMHIEQDEYMSLDFSYEFSYYPFSFLRRKRFQPSIGAKGGVLLLSENDVKDSYKKSLFLGPIISAEYYITKRFGVYMQTEYRICPNFDNSHFNWGLGIFGAFSLND